MFGFSCVLVWLYVVCVVWDYELYFVFYHSILFVSI